ncbi:hypothetical protein NLJ89_g5577 [Agrocybe chaxingu]|uniref:F-box domain-containing protein n=1 Tax=Agrocybe chaxingu TaxID=84603 RepID=A0A9W8K828_9AGAR|nr:hypothetical protein NLJ89_g5577 [Agrocybe chaxingu]
MNDTRRSTRIKRSKRSPTPEEEIFCSERGTNSTGLAVLPDELLLEILSYYPPLPHPTSRNNRVNAQAHIERRERLLALSRTCSNLRRFFRPYIWERIEVCEGMRVGNSVLAFGLKKDDKEFAIELVRQLEIVTIRDATLAQHVKIVNVDISTFSVHSVLLELGRCMALFDNLHTVRIELNLGYRGNNLAALRAFRKYTYPQIRNVIISKWIYPLLDSCPQVRTILQCGYDRDNVFERTLFDHLRNTPLLEVLDLDLLADEFEPLVKSCPLLREIAIASHYGGASVLVEQISKLDELKHLQSITLRTGEAGVLAWAKKHLLSIQNADKQEKIISISESWRQTAQYLPAPLPDQRNTIASYVERIKP